VASWMNYTRCMPAGEDINVRTMCMCVYRVSRNDRFRFLYFPSKATRQHDVYRGKQSRMSRVLLLCLRILIHKLRVYLFEFLSHTRTRVEMQRLAKPLNTWLVCKLSTRYVISTIFLCETPKFLFTTVL